MNDKTAKTLRRYARKCVANPETATIPDGWQTWKPFVRAVRFEMKRAGKRGALPGVVS